MAKDIFIKNTGNDANDGLTKETPKLTFTGAIAILTLGDSIKVLSDILIPSKIILNSLSSGYTFTEIIGVNDAGVEDGTRRRIYGATVDYIFQITGGNTYCWRISNFEYDGFTEHVFQTSNVSYGSIYSNFKITGGKGMFSTNGNAYAVIEDFEIYGCSGAYPLYFTSGKARRGVFKSCVMVNSYIIYSSGQANIRDIIISSCSCAGNDYGLFYAPGAIFDNIIVDRCLISGLNSNFAWAGNWSNLLLTHITFTGATARTIFKSLITVPTFVYNMNMYDIVGSPGLRNTLSAASMTTKNINTLTESPYLVDDGDNYALHPGYSDRRKRQELSAYSGLWEVQV